MDWRMVNFLIFFARALSDQLEPFFFFWAVQLTYVWVSKCMQMTVLLENKYISKTSSGLWSMEFAYVVTVFKPVFISYRVWTVTCTLAHTSNFLNRRLTLYKGQTTWLSEKGLHIYCLLQISPSNTCQNFQALVSIVQGSYSFNIRVTSES